jgi:hypothetical protein
MTNKKKPPHDKDPSGKEEQDKDFDPTIPEEGVVVPESADAIDFIGTHLPSDTDIATAAREAFGNTLPEELIHDLMRSSTEINESVRRIMHEHMKLGYRFGEILRTVHRAYITVYSDNPKTLQRARSDAFAYIEKIHRVSFSKIRLHIDAYAKFHSNSEAVEFLRQTDMQMLLGKDIGDDVVNAVIEARKGSPEMSTREVKELIAAFRHKQDELTATLEQVETINTELARVTAAYDLSRAEEKRLQREMETMRLDQTETEEAMGRLRNDLSLSGDTRNALHQELAAVQKERDAARREVSELMNRPALKEDPEAREDSRRANEHFKRLQSESEQLEQRIESQRAEEEAIAARLAQAEETLAARSRVQEKVDSMITKFGEFAQEYHSAQLYCTADGSAQRFAGIFDALGDVVARFNAEIHAARRAA